MPVRLRLVVYFTEIYVSCTERQQGVPLNDQRAGAKTTHQQPSTMLTKEQTKMRTSDEFSTKSLQVKFNT